MHPLHERAYNLCQEHRRLEIEIIQVLSEIDRLKIFRHLGFPSLFQYAVAALRLSEATAYQFISVMRKANEVPALAQALSEKKISVAKASRIVSALDLQNAESLVRFAAEHSSRETDREVARLSPRAVKSDRTRFVAENEVRLEITLPKDVFDKLERAKALQPDNFSLGEVLGRVLEDYLERKDPARKARRCLRKPPARGKATTKNKIGLRKPLSANEKHQVYARDGGRCTHIGSNGQRCDNTRWLHIHHIRPVSQGGGNAPENLTTLCSAHHDLVHQMSFPIDGQITWLKAPVLAYG